LRASAIRIRWNWRRYCAANPGISNIHGAIQLDLKQSSKIRKYHPTEYLLRLYYEQVSQLPRWYRICHSNQRFPDQIRPGNVHTSKQSGLHSRFLSKQLFRRHAFMNNNQNFRFIYLHVRSTPRRSKGKIAIQTFARLRLLVRTHSL
jgi:hypothetical protein